jgi:phage gpG-like protein
MSDAFNLEVKIHGAQLRAVIQLRQQLENPQALMKKLGAMVLGASLDSFKKQALGDFKWEPRYPTQPPPKLNMAGFVSDFKNGRATPKPIRFVDRPALIDEGYRGGLVSSMTYKPIDSTSFQVGTNKSYASLHQHGGTTSIPISEQMKKGIRNWLYTKKGGLKKKAAPYADKVEPLLGKSSWDQRVIARPFVGIFPTLWHDILKAIEEHFDKYTGNAH